MPVTVELLPPPKSGLQSATVLEAMSVLENTVKFVAHATPERHSGDLTLDDVYSPTNDDLVVSSSLDCIRSIFFIGFLEGNDVSCRRAFLLIYFSSAVVAFSGTLVDFDAAFTHFKCTFTLTTKQAVLRGFD